MSASESPPAGTDLRTIAAHSLVAGLCVLLPVPIVDDWARDLVRRRQTMELARKYGVQLTGIDAKVLASGHRPVTAGGCLQGCVVWAVVTPVRFVVLGIVRKMVRKILVFLLVKDMADTISRSLHEGYLVRHALALGALAAPPGGAADRATPDPEVLRVRRAIEETCAEVDPRPIVRLATTTLRGSRRAVRKAGRSLGRLLRSLRGRKDEAEIYERLEDAGESELAGVIDEMAADLEEQAPYLRRLEQLLESRLMGSKHRISPAASI